MDVVVVVFLMAIVSLLSGVLVGAVKFLKNHMEQDAERRRLQPICGCEHNLSFHDPKTGTCHGRRKVEVDWSDQGKPVRWDDEPCTCRRYTGPEPITTYYAPEIGPAPSE